MKIKGSNILFLTKSDDIYYNYQLENNKWIIDYKFYDSNNFYYCYDGNSSFKYFLIKFLEKKKIPYEETWNTISIPKENVIIK